MINIFSVTKGIFSLLDTNKYTGEIMIYMRFFFFSVKNKLRFWYNTMCHSTPTIYITSQESTV